MILPGIIENRYSVSTWGKVYDNFTGKYYPTENARCERFYPAVHMYFIDGSIRTIKIHHLMIKAFRPLDYEKEIYTDIDHKDGIKYHNWIWNIERVTHQVNIQRCVDIGLYPLAENQQNSIMTNDQVKLICEMISLGYKVSDIISQLKPLIPNISKHIVNDIKGLRNYTSISQSYDFSNMHYYNTRDNMYPEELIEAICKLLEEDYNITSSKAAYKVGIDFKNISEKEKTKFRNMFYRLKHKSLYKNICNKYNYDYCSTTIEN